MTIRAAFDLGTLSTRCLVDDGVARSRAETLTRMGEGMEVGGAFTPAALQRVTEALGAMKAGLDADAEIVAVATEAARRAATVSPLADVVDAALGVELRVLSPDEEGKLAFAGATGGSDTDGAVVVIDIGGGSTEFTVGSTGDGVLGTFSAPIGALGVCEQFLHHDPPRADELSAALSVIELHLDDVVREVPLIGSVAGTGHVILLGGTAATTAAVEIGLATPTHGDVDGFELTRAAAEDVFRTLATENAEDRAFNPGLAPDRVDVIVGGLCILIEIMRTFDLSSVTVSVADLLDGLIQEATS